MVALFHGLVGSNLAAYPHLRSFSHHGGSLFFFGISGYLITTRLFARSTGRRRISLLVFHIRRAFRLLPALAVYLLVLLVLHALHVIALAQADWAAPLFLGNYLIGSEYTRHLWSLAVEVHFYLVWPVCIALLGWRRSLWAAAGVLLAVGTWRPYALAHFVPAPGSTNYEAIHGAWLARTDMRLDFVIAGCLVAGLIRLYARGIRIVHRLGSIPGLLCLTAALIIGSRMLNNSRVLDSRTCEAVVMALVVICSSLTATWFSTNILQSRPLLFLGKISYSFYLWQQLVFAQWDSPLLQSPWMLPVKLAVAICVAWVSFTLVEKPMIVVGRRYVQRWRGLEALPAEAAAEPSPA